MKNKKITLSYQDWVYFNYWWASHAELKLEDAVDLFKKEWGIR